MSPAAAAKPGWRTTEGIAAIVTLVGALVAVVAELDVVVQVACVVTAGVVSCVYIICRTRLKVAALPRKAGDH